MPRLGKTSNPGLGRDFYFFGKLFYFFGKFRSKILAARSEREHPGSFIIARKGYYYVLKDKARRNPGTFTLHIVPEKGSPSIWRFSTVKKAISVGRKEFNSINYDWYVTDKNGTVVYSKKSPHLRNPEWKPPFAKRKRKRLGVLYQRAFQKFSRENPRRQGVLIYGRILRIFGKKTEGPYKGQEFVHDFEPGAIMVGMPDGSLRISHP